MNITDLSYLENLSEESSVSGGVGNGEASIDFRRNTRTQNRNRNRINSRVEISGNTALTGGNALALGNNTFTEANFLALTTPGSSQSAGFLTAGTGN